MITVQEVARLALRIEEGLTTRFDVELYMRLVSLANIDVEDVEKHIKLIEGPKWKK